VCPRAVRFALDEATGGSERLPRIGDAGAGAHLATLDIRFTTANRGFITFVSSTVQSIS